MSSKSQMTLNAYGKINLALDVIRRREDGYHEVRMIMQTVRLHDKVRLQKEKEPGIRLKTNLSFLPTDTSNLAYRAAAMLMNEFQIQEGVSINLEKHIPVAAGMAGGSADCAAVLHGINRLFHLGLSLKELQERGVKLGADVPYCLMGGTALAEGIGEKLTPLTPAPGKILLIAKPPISLSTKEIYTKLVLNEETVHPDIEGMLQAIERQQFEQMVSCMGNVLETAALPGHPEITAIKETMLKYGAKGAMMSGSGPTVFGFFDTREQAEQAADVCRKQKLANQVYLSSFYPDEK
jgi:4-diphosphocytidyl-2-C-methyl-D-erythritol kinase